MTDTEIIIEHIKVKDLDEFGAKVVGEAVPGQFIPITRQRALAMSKNPYAKPEDTGLLVAYRGDEIVGYFGIMAVMLQHGGKLSRAQWFTTWLVSPKLLGKRVGSRLLESALALGHDFFIVGSQPARRVCRKYGFHDLGPYVFWQIDLGLAGRYNPVTVLLRAARKAGHIAGVKLEINLVNDKAAKFFDRLFGPVIKPGIYAALQRKAGAGLTEITTRRVEQVRATEGRAALDANKTGFYRDAQAINWMLAYPWVVGPGESPTVEMDYYFSDVRERFEFIALEVYAQDDQTYQGYVVFQLTTLRGKLVLKVLDHNIEDPKYRQHILALALQLGKENRADLIEVAQPLAKPIEGGLVERLLLRRRERQYQCYPQSKESALAQYWHQIELEMPDGDLPFT